MVVVGFGECCIDEYWVGFMWCVSNDVIYGVVWLFYGCENGDVLIDSVMFEGEVLIEGLIEEIVSLLKECGVIDVCWYVGCFEFEYCDDCGVLLYVDLFGEIVYVEMLEDVLFV